MSHRDVGRREFIGLTVGVGATMGAMAGSARAALKQETSMPPDEFRKKLLQCLGGPWPDAAPLQPQLRKNISKKGYRTESISYEVEPGDRVAALLLIPDGVDAEHPAPAVAVWHQHAGKYHLGKSEPAGLLGNPMHHTGVALVKEGYVVLCPDAICFEERQDPTGRLRGMQYERFSFLKYLVDGKCMIWKNILDMRRAIDYLCSRAEVQTEAIGCYGHSMGSTHTFMVGPWEPRLKALVANCCLPTYEGIHNHHLLHCFPNFIPGIYQYGDHPEIAALTAPRALHINLGEIDSGSPIQVARAGCERIAESYAQQGVADRFRYFIEPETGHVLSPAMWEQTKEWFRLHLRSA